MIKKYVVEYYKRVTVEAKNESEAREKARKLIDKGTYNSGYDIWEYERN